MNGSEERTLRNMERPSLTLKAAREDTKGLFIGSAASLVHKYRGPDGTSTPLHKMKITLIKLSRDKPMAVGGMGMLSTSNYAARKFGVRAAMPGTNEWQLGTLQSPSKCNDLINRDLNGQ